MTDTDDTDRPTTSDGRDEAASGPKERRGPRLARLWPLLVIGALIVLFFALGWDRYLSFQALEQHREQLLAWTAAHRLTVIAAFIAAYAAMVALSLPGAVWATLAGGFLFGTVEAAAYVVVAATLGATAIFLIARYALHDFFEAKAGPAMRRMEAGFNENALSYMFVLRLVPLFPFWLVNLVPALLGVKLRTYVIGTFFGIMPGSLVYCSVGNGLGALFERGQRPDLGIIFEPAILLPILGLAGLSLIPIVYKRRRRMPPGGPVG